MQTVSRKRKKLDPDDFLLEGKREARPGHQTATHWSSPIHSILCDQLFKCIFILFFGLSLISECGSRMLYSLKFEILFNNRT